MQALLAGFFALAIVQAPALNARIVIERTVYALDYALPGGILPELCTDVGHPAHDDEKHILTPACFACVLVAAPGLATAAPGEATRALFATDADFRIGRAIGRPQAASAAQLARGPPTKSIS
ncbi:MAG TPA: hypothetical protein PKA33_17690 [Amaricoccus sp.]|uniref:hypothetical protein n=1 Tax=Amaricoccus sp. TaxID=1872485 RepID=UPI002BF6B0E1|nr:hypothetical protein [Amaricoccus sp.]HMQ93262.1 hypothetical protein [Amaricoccus sp.]HMR60737.1 hypothetical protein [Amaricoccus sp.]HMU01180.1 hypothetical protein [Amaricoccus sp.]